MPDYKDIDRRFNEKFDNDEFPFPDRWLVERILDFIHTIAKEERAKGREEGIEAFKKDILLIANSLRNSKQEELTNYHLWIKYVHHAEASWKRDGPVTRVNANA
jgi:hypothetical protein